MPRPVVIDFLPIERPQAALVRIVRGPARHDALSHGVDPSPELRQSPFRGSSAIRTAACAPVVGPDAFVLRSGVKLEPDGQSHVAEFDVDGGRM